MIKNQQAISSPKPPRLLWKWLTGLLGVCLAERIILFLFYPPVSLNDTGSYRRLAGTVFNDWAKYDGTRTPGYPVFLALIGSDQAVVAVQMILGILITLIVFYLGYRISNQVLFAGLAALGHTLNLNQLFFETNLITETLATFWVMLGLLGACLWILFPGKRSIWLGLAIGLAASLAALTRPLFVFLPFWLAIFMAFFCKGMKISFDWRPLATTFALGAVIIFGWVNYIHENFYMWNMSSMAGFNSVQHTGYYFEYVPDKFASLRDTYIRFRDERIAKYGTQGTAIWDAIPEMQKESGYSFFEMSALLSHLSMDLIREHPNLYLKYVWEGWLIFWLAPVYYVKSNMPSELLGEVFRYLIYGERALLIGANILFIVSSAASFVSRKIRQVLKTTPFWGLIASTIWVCSVVQTLLDHGDNPRFLVPLQSMAVLWSLWVLYQLALKYLPIRKSKVQSSDRVKP
jgi:4-amino-4-deoxy-L-arabinose transferase-like glycosyltransferase